MKVFKAKFFFKTRYALKCLSFCFTGRISTVTVTEGHAGEGLKPFLSMSKNRANTQDAVPGLFFSLLVLG